nr:hypothetical protein [Tanacetum cinerariifolium]
GRQADKQAEIYNIDLDHSLKVLSMQEVDSEVQEVVEVVTTAKFITEVVTAAVTQGSDASATIPVDKGKGIMVEALKPMKKNDQIKMDAEYARKLQEEIDRDHDGFSKDINWDAAIDHDDDVFVEATPLASKVPVVDYQIVLIDNKPRFKIIRANETHQLYISFATPLKNFD